MLRPIHSAALLTVAALAFTAPARADAQRVDSPVRVGIGGGVAFPNGDIARGMHGGYSVSGVITIDPPRWPVGFEVSGTLYGFSPRGDNINGQVMSVTGSVLVPVAGVIGKPYLIGGVGYYNTQWPVTGPLDAERDFGVHAGIGTKVGNGRREFHIQARFHEVFAENGIDGRPRSREIIPLSFVFVL